MSVRFLTKVLVMSVGALSIGTVIAENTQIQQYGTASNETANVLSTVDNLNDLNTSKFNQLDEQNQNEIAEQYGISSEEYKKYLAIRGTSSIGQYYSGKNLNPNYLLADYYLSKNETEKADRYIANYAKQEHDEVARQLYIQKHFQAAAQKYDPTHTPIQLKGPIPKGYVTYGVQKNNSIIDGVMQQISNISITSDAKYVLIESVDSQNIHLDDLMKKLSSLSNVQLDIYFTGNDTTDEQIVEWARKYSLGKYIGSGMVTINHAGEFINGLSAQIGKKVPINTLLKNNNGNYKIISWSSINE